MEFAIILAYFDITGCDEPARAHNENRIDNWIKARIRGFTEIGYVPKSRVIFKKNW